VNIWPDQEVTVGANITIPSFSMHFRLEAKRDNGSDFEWEGDLTFPTILNRLTNPEKKEWARGMMLDLIRFIIETKEP